MYNLIKLVYLVYIRCTNSEEIYKNLMSFLHRFTLTIVLKNCELSKAVNVVEFQKNYKSIDFYFYNIITMSRQNFYSNRITNS